MKKFLFALFLSLSTFLAYSQPIVWKQHIGQTFVFEISEREALEVLKTRPNDSLIQGNLHTLVDTFSNTWENKPKQGHFIFANIVKNRVYLEYVPIIPFQVFLFKEYGALTFQIIDLSGEIRGDAKVRLNKTKVKYNPQTRTYSFPSPSNRRAILSIELDGFTAFFDEEKHFGTTNYNYRYFGDREGYYKAFYSYMITDKNKYKPGETVRFKSYIVSDSKNALRKDLELWLYIDYRNEKKLLDITPYHAGGYADEFRLHDSLKLKLDQEYTLQLRAKNGSIRARTKFRYEDYELFDNNLEVTLKTRHHFSPDTNVVEIKARDANGLLLKNVKAHVLVQRKSVSTSYVPVLLLPDTLLYKQIELSESGVTKIEILPTLFKESDCDYEIRVDATTFENQHMESRNTASFYYSHFDLKQTTVNDSIRFTFYELGKEKEIKAELSYNGDTEKRQVTLPYQEKFNQSIDAYNFKVLDPDFSKSFPAEKIVSSLDLLGGLKSGSLDIQLKNPLQLEVSWYIYEGSKLLQAGSGKELKFTYAKVNHAKTYYVEIFYFIGNKEQIFRRSFSAPKDDLQIELDLPERIYPGQKLDASISVKDQQGNPVPDVDLTALSVNSLLGYAIPDLPYYGSQPATRQQKSDYSIKRKNYSFNLPVNYGFWNPIAHLDQTDFYRFIYPKDTLFTYSISTPDSTTQFAPFVMKDGNSVDIYVIEHGGFGTYFTSSATPAYFSWTEQPQNYSFPISPDYPHKITLRLHDKVLIIDSIQFEKGKKTLLSLDVDHLPKGVKVVNFKKVLRNPELLRSRDRYTRRYAKKDSVYVFTKPEILRYSKYISRIPAFFGDTAYIEQSGNFYPVLFSCTQHRNRTVLAGPIPQGMSQYNRGVQYRHEGGFLYEYDTNVVYKYPSEVCPQRLVFSSNDKFNNLNDFQLTRESFLKENRMLCTPFNTWQPSVIGYSKSNLDLTFLLPANKDRSGIYNLFLEDCVSGKIVYPYHSPKSNESSIPEGTYNAVLLYANGKYLTVNPVSVKHNTLLIVDWQKVSLHDADSLSERWMKNNPLFLSEISKQRPVRNTDVITKFSSQRNRISGTVFDDKTGEPIAFATISASEDGRHVGGAYSDDEGRFSIFLENSCVDLEISFVGYARKRITEVCPGTELEIMMRSENMLLGGVEVIDYKIPLTDKDKTVSGSVIAREDVARVASRSENPKLSTVGGVRGSRDEGTVQYIDGIRVRGASSLPESALENSFDVYKSRNFDDRFENTESTQHEDSAEDRFYQTLLLLNGLRNNFSDVGFWEPKLYTDENGKAGFPVTFPDNITQWEALVYAMNNKLQTGTFRRSIKSYKPLMAELKMPQFLVAGDTSYFAGNIRNYTHDSLIQGHIVFKMDGDTTLQTSIQFTHSYQNQLFATASKSDSIQATYLFTRNDGYNDGEQRTIPIVRQGTELAEGTLGILKNGDSLQIAAKDGETVYVTLTGQPLDIYMSAASYLSGYPYSCNEQLASKLIGLLSLKSCKKYQGKLFLYDPRIHALIRRLLDNQNEEKLWSWWGNSSRTSYWMSAHILRALKMAKDAGYQVDLNIQKTGEDYINLLGYRNVSLNDLEILHALSAWGANQNYEKAIQLFERMIGQYEHHEDSLASRNKYYKPNSYLKEKLLIAGIRKEQKLHYSPQEITKYLKKDVLGRAYCDDGLQKFHWYSDNLATTLLAYNLVKNDSSLQQWKEPLQLYILNSRSNGFWNTYQSASVLATILPDLLSESATKKTPAKVVLKGKETRTINEFPYESQLQEGEFLSVEKTEGMPLIYSSYTQKQETQKHSGEAFEISSNFEARQLTAGKPAILRVTLQVKQKNAEHVMIEIPIPAGCSYASKPQHHKQGEVHREYFKEKTVIFCEKLPQGTYSYDIELLPRFSGKYTVNPAKAELMYFPVVNANNDLEKIEITGNENAR